MNDLTEIQFPEQRVSQQLESKNPGKDKLVDLPVLSALIHTGVGLFGESQLKSPDPIFNQLQQNAQLAQRLGQEQRAWRELLEFLALHPQKLELSPALSQLVADFSLSLADVFILALCGEIENNYLLNIAVSQLQSPDDNPRPSLHLIHHLVLHLFGTAITPSEIAVHPLVSHGVLDITGNEPLPMRSLSINSRLWQLLNIQQTSLPPQPWPDTQHLGPQDRTLMPESLSSELPKLVQLIREGVVRGVVLRGAEKNAWIVANELALSLGLSPVTLSASLWREDKLFHLACRYCCWLPVVALRLGPADRFEQDPGILSSLSYPLVFVTGREGTIEIDGLVEIDIPETCVQQRQKLWQRFLGSENPMVSELAQSALIDGSTIQELVSTAKLDAQRQNRAINRQDLISARRRQGGSQLRQLAQPVVRTVERDALVLPVNVAQQFDQLIHRCIQRENLWKNLGSTAAASKNFGVRALFCGESGTGKTLAASHLATRLGAPLYRLDLASVMNKYIGETEKNLGLLLDQAVANDTILLLDEADALFGKRTEGDSAGDRFANMLTNFLLTRIESHNGIVILTSNNRSRIDSAFTRRLDSVIEFAPPNAQERYAIWLSHLGARAPDLKLCQLLASYCELPGGFIRNAVLNAAAAESDNIDRAISVDSLLQALKEEYRKLGRAIPPSIDQLRGKHG